MEVDVLNFHTLLAAASPAGHIRHGSHDAKAAEEALGRFMDALGHQGPGLVAVTGLPGYHKLRNQLLAMAPTLALMPEEELQAVLKDNKLGTDVPLKDPNRPVSSFAAQLHFTSLEEEEEEGEDDEKMSAVGQDTLLGNLFRQLGLCMVKVGLLAASLCDLVIAGAGLEEAILNSATAKGRLIHYHSRRKSSIPRQQEANAADKWQDWHLDYAIFTLLTAPLFCNWRIQRQSDGNLTTVADVSPPPGDHCCLRILHAACRTFNFLTIPPDCVVIQVGEAAQILSGGKLRATAHCVCRPCGVEQEVVSRQTFAVFLQPPWSKALWPPPASDPGAVLGCDVHLLTSHHAGLDEEELSQVHQAIPPLSSRWTPGCTFADFSRNTIRHYYGASGRQQTRSERPG